MAKFYLSYLCFLIAKVLALAQVDSLVRRHEIGHEGSIRSMRLLQQHAQAEPTVGANLASMRAGVEEAIPTVPLLSGSVVKIKNRKSATYLAACSECTGVATAGLDNSCRGLLGSDTGCGFTVSDTIASEFEIIKVGFSSGQPIHHNDLVVIKSRPNAADGNFYAYLGICGASSEPDTSNLVRFYAGDASSPATLPDPVMFTVSKESGHGPVLLGEYISFVKAARSESTPGVGTFLASVGVGSTTGHCGAETNLYTRAITSTTAQDHRWQAMWQVSNVTRPAELPA